VLEDGGYAYQRRTGKEHGVWTHSDEARPAIHVPSTPRDPDYALVRLRRAVRVGSTPHIPQGLVTDMPKSTANTAEQPLPEQLAALANPALKRRASALEAGVSTTSHEVRGNPKDLAAWLRKCLTSGAVKIEDLQLAADKLYLTSTHVSKARVAI